MDLPKQGDVRRGYDRARPGYRYATVIRSSDVEIVYGKLCTPDPYSREVGSLYVNSPELLEHTPCYTKDPAYFHDSPEEFNRYYPKTVAAVPPGAPAAMWKMLWLARLRRDLAEYNLEEVMEAVAEARHLHMDVLPNGIDAAIESVKCACKSAAKSLTVNRSRT